MTSAPRYEVVEGKTWLHMPNGPVLFQPGAHIDYEGWPNANMKPLNDAARAVVKERDHIRARGGNLPPRPGAAMSVAASSQSKPPKDGGNHERAAAVTIPENWRDLAPIAQYNLARKMFGTFDVPEGKTRAQQAIDLIANEEKRRTEAEAA